MNLATGIGTWLESGGMSMKENMSIIIRLVCFTIMVLMVIPTLGTGVPMDDEKEDCRGVENGFEVMEFTPEILRYSLDTFEEFRNAEAQSSNISFIAGENGDGRIRLYTGLGDVTVTGPYIATQPVYAETFTMRAGAYLRASGTDTVEIYARNFVMMKGSVMDLRGSEMRNWVGPMMGMTHFRTTGTISSTGTEAEAAPEGADTVEREVTGVTVEVLKATGEEEEKRGPRTEMQENWSSPQEEEGEREGIATIRAELRDWGEGRSR